MEEELTVFQQMNTRVGDTLWNLKTYFIHFSPFGYWYFPKGENKPAVSFQLDFKYYVKDLKGSWNKKDEAGPEVKYVHLSFYLV